MASSAAALCVFFFFVSTRSAWRTKLLFFILQIIYHLLCYFIGLSRAFAVKVATNVSSFMV
jgi:hypothetical protein